MRYLMILGLALLSAGCAELDMRRSSEDCRGRTERNTPGSYPCACCKRY